MNGIEWIVDAQGCDPESLRDLARLQAFFARVIRELGLRPVGDAQWHQFPGTGGITGLCLLAESHLSCHTFPEYGSLCLNLFCCVPRETWDFDRACREHFGAASVSVRSLTREYAAADKSLAHAESAG